MRWECPMKIQYHQRVRKQVEMSIFHRIQLMEFRLRRLSMAVDEDRSSFSDLDPCRFGVHPQSSAGVATGLMNGNFMLII